ncbi:MAG: NAD(P)/FAD-dependent oxidoreductase [Pyrinomonadaceae bacterium]
MKIFDVVIVGAGLAGLQCAKTLSAAGAKVLLVDRKTALDEGVHTTGIFVRKTLEDFAIPADCLGKAVRHVSLYSPARKVLNLQSSHDEFRVGKMGKLYQRFLEDCLEHGIEYRGGTRYAGIKRSGTETIVKFENPGKSWTVKTRVIIGADGANSKIARDLGLDENKEWIVGFEEVYRGVPPGDEPRLHCFLDAKLAPGYLAWVTNDGEDVHIGVGGYAAKFNPREALLKFKEKIGNSIVDLTKAELVETRGGRIPVGGILSRIANERGLLIGDAAGAVSPLTAGGLDPCLRLSTIAANVVLASLKAGEPEILQSYSGDLFRARFVSRIWMRRVLAAMNNQTLLELGCMAMRLPILRSFAAHVFFGRGSFPDDVKLLEIESRKTLKIAYK